MSDPFILCDGLVKIYKVADLEMVALQGLDLMVQPGELMGIVGSSGSGKSTLMNILGGLDRPTAGKVMVDGRDLLRMPDRHLNRYRREKVGFVWQQSARNLVPYLNAVNNVILPMTLAGTTGRGKKRYAEELLDIVGLSDRKYHHLSELSGGEQQRVAIAVAIANNPSLLLADEPTGELDSATAQHIYGTFQMLTRELGITTLIVSHDPNIARHVDRVVGIRDGMLASETRRQNNERYIDGRAQSDEVGDEQTDESFEELVVLDSAGRVHIPKDYLEQFNIKGRAQLEVTENGILIRPMVEGVGAKEMDAQRTNPSHTDVQTQGGGVRRFFGRFGRKDKA